MTCKGSEPVLHGSAGQVDGDSPPLQELWRTEHGSLRVSRAADGGRHTLGCDERPVSPAVCGELQMDAVGRRRSLTAAHAQIKLQERRARHLEVPALSVTRPL